MRPIRTRITMAFAGAFIASLLTFALVILIARRNAAMSDVIERAHREADQTLQLIDRTRSLANEPMFVDSDSLIAAGVSPVMRRFLEVVDDYVIVLDPLDYELFSSPRVGQLTFTDRERLVAAARAMRDVRQVARVQLRSDDVVMAMRFSDTEGATRIQR